MAERIDFDALAGMLEAVAVRIRDDQVHLAALDAATGDGDHGAAMGKVADAIDQCVRGAGHGNIATLLSEVGWAIMGVDAGSTGPLYGSLFLGMSGGCSETDHLDPAALAAALEAGMTRLRTLSRAEAGDKTMIDALLPAVGAARAVADGGGSMDDALNAAATAAKEGAEQTAPMRAAFGRARNIGDRSIGHVDPGAASMSLVFTGFREGWARG